MQAQLSQVQREIQELRAHVSRIKHIRRTHSATSIQLSLANTVSTVSLTAQWRRYEEECIVMNTAAGLPTQSCCSSQPDSAVSQSITNDVTNTISETVNDIFMYSTSSCDSYTSSQDSGHSLLEFDHQTEQPRDESNSVPSPPTVLDISNVDQACSGAHNQSEELLDLTLSPDSKVQLTCPHSTEINDRDSSQIPYCAKRLQFLTKSKVIEEQPPAHSYYNDIDAELYQRPECVGEEEGCSQSTSFDDSLNMYEDDWSRLHDHVSIHDRVRRQCLNENRESSAKHLPNRTVDSDLTEFHHRPLSKKSVTHKVGKSKRASISKRLTRLGRNIRKFGAKKLRLETLAVL